MSYVLTRIDWYIEIKKNRINHKKWYYSVLHLRSGDLMVANNTMLLRSYLLFSMCHSVSQFTVIKKLSYCLETTRLKSLPKIAQMDVEMIT